MAATDVLGNAVSLDTIKESLEMVDGVYKNVDEIVNSIVEPICKELDEYMGKIDKSLVEDEISIEDLEEIILNLPSFLYMISTKREKMKLKESVSRTIYKNAYSNARGEIKGTVADKDAHAVTSSVIEAISVVVYDRVVSIIKSKEEAATEMLNSAKKILSFRTAELGISSYTDGGGRR